ncbi:Gfo/Idh/MocA family oxidoreductase [Chitinophaga rhizophila]|uniref:Gfo/Idh/MocA family oxidoreductase n=1 Tax=Chitinophaga rhizophila TaxID=2866212 RepID=A0ABS7GAR6_9BACT|nr:Gfo/Idh/MocA family oxidoreductase [Chitinophaga rhizophila]MBW8684762.1 Gfo/Idh/MocA family oxidoreductase [Chitinophaga rhizophila]
MKNHEEKIHVILIGCGPHARRVYLPALRTLKNVNLALVIDLESEQSVVQHALGNDHDTALWLIQPFNSQLPPELSTRLSQFVREKQIKGVIIATEPLVHRAYAEWALANSLSILMDKPITTRVNVTSNIENAKGIVDDYQTLYAAYQELQRKAETVFMVNSHRRFHKGFQFVKEQIHEVAMRTNCPVNFIQAYHSDGQWRLPNEIISQKYHPYCFGYGKASHSGYHIFDTIYQFYKASALREKLADEMEVISSFIKPNGFFTQLNEHDYRNIFGDAYKQENTWTEEQLRETCKDFGEIDLSAIIALKKYGNVIANFNVNLVHNGFAGRTWLKPGKDLYKGNGRIKHESYHIQQGPFQSIQIHAYQAYDKHDQNNGKEEFLGGKNHFDIYVFRNPFIAEGSPQPAVYKYSDLADSHTGETDAAITMEKVKFTVVAQFVDYLTGKITKKEVVSQIEDHLMPVTMMSGVYCSNITKQRAYYGFNVPAAEQEVDICSYYGSSDAIV